MTTKKQHQQEAAFTAEIHAFARMDGAKAAATGQAIESCPHGGKWGSPALASAWANGFTHYMNIVPVAARM